MSFGAFLQKALTAHRNTSKTRGKSPVELPLERRVRLPAIADFNLCEPTLFKVNVMTNTRTMWEQRWRRPYLNQNHNIRTQMWDLHITMKLLQWHHLPSINSLNHQSLCELQQQIGTTRLESTYPQTCSKNQGGCYDFKETARNLEVLLKFQSTKEELTWRTLLLCR